MDMIGFDNEFMSDPCTHSKILLPIPENARESECAMRMTECVAFRVWSATGDFLDKDVTRLMRVPRGV